MNLGDDRIPSLYRTACQALDDIEKDLLEEKRKLEEIVDKKLGLNIEMFNTEIQQELKEGCEFLEVCGIENVEIGSVLSNVANSFVEKTKEEEKRLKWNELWDELNKHLSSLQEMEQQLREYYNYCLYQKAMTETEQDFEHLDLNNEGELILEPLPVLDASCESESLLAHKECLKLVNDLDAARIKKKELQKQLEAYHGLPPDVTLAEEELNSLRLHYKKLSEEFKKKSDS